MPEFMLDTDMVSWALQGRGAVAARVLAHRPSQISISSITLAELRFGADAKASRALHRLINAFVRPIDVLPFDQAAADKVRHFETYNRTPAAQRVAEIVSALRASPGAVLVASGDAALAGALASAIEPPRLAVLDVDGFTTASDDGYLGHLYVPGLRRAGDVRTASELAQGRLVIHNAAADFDAPGARVQQSRLTPAEIVALVRQP